MHSSYHQYNLAKSPPANDYGDDGRGASVRKRPYVFVSEQLGALLRVAITLTLQYFDAGPSRTQRFIVWFGSWLAFPFSDCRDLFRRFPCVFTVGHAVNRIEAANGALS
jgi:hypothetical protein